MSSCVPFLFFFNFEKHPLVFWKTKKDATFKIDFRFSKNKNHEFWMIVCVFIENIYDRGFELTRWYGTLSAGIPKIYFLHTLKFSWYGLTMFSYDLVIHLNKQYTRRYGNRDGPCPWSSGRFDGRWNLDRTGSGILIIDFTCP